MNVHHSSSVVALSRRNPKIPLRHCLDLFIHYALSSVRPTLLREGVIGKASLDRALSCRPVHTFQQLECGTVRPRGLVCSIIITLAGDQPGQGALTRGDEAGPRSRTSHNDRRSI